MGRKRKEPKTVVLRVFDEGKKLTEEEKQWLLGNRKKERKTVNGK